MVYEYIDIQKTSFKMYIRAFVQRIVKWLSLKRRLSSFIKEKKRYQKKDLY